MKKRLLAILLIVVMAVSLTACGSSGGETTTKAPETTTKAPETTTKAPETTTAKPEDTTTSGGSGGIGKDVKDIKLAFCINNMADAFPITILRGVKDCIKDYGIPEENLIYQGSPVSDFTQQTTILENMLIGTDVDGLLIIPTGGDNMLIPIQEAIETYNIPVVTMDQGITDENSFIAHVSSDNYIGGQMAAEALDTLIKEAGAKSMRVATIGSNPAADSNQNRLAGWRDRIKELGYTVVSEQWCLNDPSTAATQTQQILLTFDDLAGMFGGNLFCSQGISNALSSDGVKLPLVCFDAGAGQVEALRNKEVDALIVQKPYLIGYEATRMMIEYLVNGTVPEKYTRLEPCIAYYDDLENPEINKYFYDVVE
ncbi:MAG: substrate-binding domain-containing protein [Lachnospiraceae bacterium]|nr:substrate-binding domain-containing protein [Lachnospiraceae bacterium]MBQ9562601.1 substrate-binding domain-containing protein [Lachnospiraceae bacterium]MBR0152970.1 substrate-binding domain-containing protein [Lachnospiraceae bacterium]